MSYLSILNTSISGYISSLCEIPQRLEHQLIHRMTECFPCLRGLDVPFCWKYMYDTHKDFGILTAQASAQRLAVMCLQDLTWATVADIPDIVGMQLGCAINNQFPHGLPAERLG